jgi:hypothetical protein
MVKERVQGFRNLKIKNLEIKELCDSGVMVLKKRSQIF